MVADVRTRRKIRRAFLSQYRPRARTLTTPENQRPNVAHFAKSARKPGRERAESRKPILKTARRTVKTLNKSTNFRMVDTYATPFLFDWPSCTPAWHYPGGSSCLVRKPCHCSRNHARRPFASARLGSRAPQTRWPAADSAPLANRERSTSQERAGRPPRLQPRTPGRAVRRGRVRRRSGGHHQEHARKAQDRPRDRGNRRLVSRSQASSGGRGSGRTPRNRSQAGRAASPVVDARVDAIRAQLSALRRAARG